MSATSLLRRIVPVTKSVTVVGQNEMRVVHCRTWDDFIVAIRTHTDGVRVFRGQGNPEWPLASALDRWMAAAKAISPEAYEQYSAGDLWPSAEFYFNQRFVESAAGTHGLTVGGRNQAETERLGRHFGLITRLLDWSQSPYVAAFFACADYLEAKNPGFLRGSPAAKVSLGGGDFSVWQLRIDKQIRDLKEVLEISDTLADDARRQKAQRGLFTRIKSTKHFDLEHLLIDHQLSDRLTRFDIEGTEAARAFLDLELMNVTFATLYPDLEGAAKQANIWHAVFALRSTIENTSTTTR